MGEQLMPGVTLQAPVGGWNAINALTAMPDTDAVLIDNLIPQATSVRSRDGYAVHTTPALTGAQTLVSYNASTPKLLLGANGNIYNITAAGAGTDLTGALGAFANNKWITNGYKDKLIFTNGADTPLEFDGTSITQMVLTGPTVTELQGSVTFKGRVIYWEKPAGTNPQAFWYAAAGAYTGALTKYALDQFTHGGYIVSCFNWTHDGGQGLDDHFVIFMSTGQVLVYAGSDPGDSTDWNLVGIYNIGEPVGAKPVTSLGGDAVIITKDGYLTLSAAIQDGRYSENSHYSFKISPAAAQAAKDYSTNFGWEGTLFTSGSLFIVNVPISGSYSNQHVRNTTTGAWTRFTGLNATTFCTHAGKLYFAGTDGKVYQYKGGSDNGGFIPMRCTQAYTYLGDAANKKMITAVEVQSNYQYPKYLHSDFWSDFNEQSLPAITDPPEPTPSDWDVAQWDVAQWGTGAYGTKVARRNASALGYAISHTLRLRSRAQRFIWYSSHIYAKQAGVV
jgi:hypothetical protein